MLRRSTNQQAKLEVVYFGDGELHSKTQYLPLPVFVLRFQVVMVLVMALINIVRPSVRLSLEELARHVSWAETVEHT